MATYTIHPTYRRSTLLWVLVALTLVAATVLVVWTLLGAEDPAGDDPAGLTPIAMGPGISVSEALASTLQQPLLVNGHLFVEADGTVYLTEVLALSYPPQRGRSLRVEGLDLSAVAGLQNAQGISWTDEYVQVLGEVNGTILTVSTNASA